jgi:hypothetical protein
METSMNLLETLTLTFAALFSLSAAVVFLSQLVRLALIVRDILRQPRHQPAIEEDAEYLRFAAEQEAISLARLDARDHTAA